jgi:mercuric reductase
MGETTMPQDRVRAAVLRHLLRGDALDLASLAAEAGLDPRAVAGTLETLNASGAIYMADGAVTAAYPLSATPTPHRVRLDGRAVYACCAIDALAVPAMQSGAATVESRCAYCNADIAVQVRGDRVTSSRPDGVVVFHAARDCCESGPAVLTRCPHINFFCGADHLSRWRSERPRLAGDTLTLAQAVGRAHEVFRSTIELVRGAAGHDR